METQRLYVCAQGKPRPIAQWLKDGQPVDEKKVGVRNSNVDSILFIRSAERDHSGKYTLILKIENMEDSATIDIRIVGKTQHSTLRIQIRTVILTYYFPSVLR